MSVQEDFENHQFSIGYIDKSFYDKDENGVYYNMAIRSNYAIWQACAAQYEAEMAELRKENRELIIAGIDHMRNGIALLGKHHQADEMAELKAYLETTCSSIEAELSNIRDERNSMLAVIEKQREALSMVVDRPNGMWYGIDDACRAALALTPDSVRLVQHGRWCEGETLDESDYYPSSYCGDEGSGIKLYYIEEGKAE